jgi:hypothetical protein
MITRGTYVKETISKWEVPIRFWIDLVIYKLASFGIDDSIVTDLKSSRQELGFYGRLGYKW